MPELETLKEGVELERVNVELPVAGDELELVYTDSEEVLLKVGLELETRTLDPVLKLSNLVAESEPDGAVLETVKLAPLVTGDALVTLNEVPLFEVLAPGAKLDITKLEPELKLPELESLKAAGDELVELNDEGVKLGAV